MELEIQRTQFVNDTKEIIKVLVVDDSAFMRVALRKMMEEDAGIEVIDVARNGQEAIEKIQKLKPDLVTMDIEMPVMDGLTALKTIMADHPVPVIMISSLTEEGADATFQALEYGAVDFIPKGGKSFVNLDIIKVAEQLRQKVRAIATKNRVRRFGLKTISRLTPTGATIEKASPIEVKPVKRSRQCQLVSIGISTGGPLALNKMLPMLPKDFSSSLLIVQHMPPTFTGPFSRRLDSLCQISVKEAAEGDIIEPGCAYVAPGGKHLKVVRERGIKLRVALDTQPSEMLFIPSVDVMMESVAANFAGTILGVIMTGMGSDGLKGMTDIKKKRGLTLAQDEASCVVYGMPKVCVDEGIIDTVLPLEKLAGEIDRLAG